MDTETRIDSESNRSEGVAASAAKPGVISASWIKSGFTLPAFVMGLTFLVYMGTTRFEFVYDDLGQIVENQFIQSWRYIPTYFTEHVWYYDSPNAPGNYYRPVFLLWLLINHSIFGLNEWGWHLTTIILHLLSTLFVFLIARKLTNDDTAACFASLIFGLHPVHVEAVAWVSGVTEPLLAALLLPSFLCFINSQQLKSRFSYLASLILFALALLSKETAVVLPLIILAYIWLFEKDKDEAALHTLKRALTILAPYFVFIVIYLTLRTFALNGFGHALVKLPFSTLFFTWPSLLWFYIRLLFWPTQLSAFYDTPYITSPSLMNFYLPAVGLIVLAAALWWVSRKSRVIKISLCWLILPMLPLLNLSYFVEGEIAHDRYLYLPSFGFAIMAAVALRKLKSAKGVLLGQPAIQIVFVGCLICAFAAGVVTQSQYWASDLLLYHRGFTIAPNNHIAANNMANELFLKGLEAEAVAIQQRVLERKPDYWMSNYNLGYSYYKSGNFEEAERYLRRAIALKPNASASQYVYLGLVEMKTNRLGEAAESIRQALQLRPFGQGYHFALATVLKKQGDLPGALDEFRKELANTPQSTASEKEIAEIEAQIASNKSKSGDVAK